MTGWTETSLNQRGENQAEALRRRMKEVDVDRVITSGMMRANQTADLAFPQIRKIEMPALKEMNFGIMEGLTMEEIQKKYPHDYALISQRKGIYTFPDGESLKNFHGRIRQAAQDLVEQIQQNQFSTTVVIVHSGTIRSLMAEWIAHDWQAHWRFQVDHCALSRIDRANDLFVLKTFNETAYLEGLLEETGN